MVGDRLTTQGKWTNLDELTPFRRNIETIMDLAELRGTKMVLMTQPRSTDPTVAFNGQAPQIDQANEVMRRIVLEGQKQKLFVDLDAMMTGRMNHVFRDLPRPGAPTRWSRLAE